VAIACLVACGLAGDNAAQAGPSEIDAAITQTGTVASFDGSTLHIVNEAPLVGMTFFDAHSMPASFFSGFASGRFELTGEFRDVLIIDARPYQRFTHGTMSFSFASPTDTYRLEASMDTLILGYTRASPSVVFADLVAAISVNQATLDLPGSGIWDSGPTISFIDNVLLTIDDHTTDVTFPTLDPWEADMHPGLSIFEYPASLDGTPQSPPSWYVPEPGLLGCLACMLFLTRRYTSNQHD